MMLKMQAYAWQIHTQMEGWLHLEVVLLRGEMMNRRKEISQLYLLLQTVWLITTCILCFAV